MTSVKSPVEGRFTYLLAILAIMLSAINMRGGLVTVGPLVEDFQQHLNLSSSEFSLLTSLPLLCFAVVSALIPMLTRRFQPTLLMLLALIGIMIGGGLRLLPMFPVIVGGTVVLGAAIAFLNVLTPGLVKAYFPNRTALMTGIYSVTMSAGAGFGAYLAIPLRDSFGSWIAPMSLWAMLPLVAIIPWLFMLKIRVQTPTVEPGQRKHSLLLNPRAWALTGYMGMQSIFFYSLAAWLPKIFMDAGLDQAAAGTSGSMLSWFGILGGFVMPLLMSRIRSMALLMAMMAALSVIILVALLLVPTLMPSVLAAGLGLTSSCMFVIALNLFALRSRNALEATALSAMAQSVGYLIAATGPLLVGGLHDLFSSWTWPLLFLVTCQIVQFCCGLPVAKGGYIAVAAEDRAQTNA